MSMWRVSLQQLRIQTPAVVRRFFCLILPLMLAMTLSAAPARANSDPSASSGMPSALPPGSDYSTALNAQLRALNQRIGALSQRESGIKSQEGALDPRIASYNERSKAVLAQLDANTQKIRAHNARVASYPNGAPPAIARALNAEANALNNEQRRLKAEAEAIAKDGDGIQAEQTQIQKQKESLERDRAALTAQHQQLFEQMTAAAIQAAAKAPASHQAHGADAARSPSRSSQVNGGDSTARSSKANTLDAYGRRNNVKVDQRLVTSYLTPSTVSKLPQAGPRNCL